MRKRKSIYRRKGNGKHKRKKKTKPVRTMRFRRNPLPRRASEIVAFLFAILGLLIVGLYDIFFVMPAIFKPNFLVLMITIITLVFLMLNTIGNMIACMIIDPSVEYKRAELLQRADPRRLEWRYCTICESWAPPRSWHCNLCAVCILKRDHHCTFMGCCIGHQNHRHFILFVIYFFILSIVTFVYNIWFLVAILGESITSWMGLPMPRIEAPDFIWLPYMHFAFCMLNFIGAGLLFGAYGYHIPLVVQGNVSPLKGKANEYDGGLCFNLESIFGKLWFIAWICPLIVSKLPDDGYTWRPIPRRATPQR